MVVLLACVFCSDAVKMRDETHSFASQREQSNLRGSERVVLQEI